VSGRAALISVGYAEKRMIEGTELLCAENVQGRLKSCLLWSRKRQGEKLSVQELLKRQGKGGLFLKVSITWLCVLLSSINKIA